MKENTKETEETECWEDSWESVGSPELKEKVDQFLLPVTNFKNLCRDMKKNKANN